MKNAMNDRFGLWACRQGVLSVMMVFSAGWLRGGEPIQMPLWEKEVPRAIGTEAKDNPTVTFYGVELADKSSPLLVIYPGGGYGALALDHEGRQIAAWANSLGMAALICEYRHRSKGYGHPCPLEDAQRAIRLARHQAKAWKIDADKIGIIGFSAGGHLASTVLTHVDFPSPVNDDIGQLSAKPNFGILCYPVIAFDKPYTHKGSQNNLLGANPDQELVLSLSNERQVQAGMAPTFLFHTQEDKGVPPENSLDFYRAMVEKGVPGELHLFQKGQHGVGLAKGIDGTEQWPQACATWLRGIGILSSVSTSPAGAP